MKRYHVFVAGIVQGVGFRWYVQRTAARLSVKGWVKNLPDGKVEITAEGETIKLEQFLAEIKNGYLGGNIQKLEKEEETYTGEFPGFDIKF
jgi:acylphosphatase